MSLAPTDPSTVYLKRERERERERYVVHPSPLVSVITSTYNHKNYIRQALESIVRQKTNFKFEIIVHDDASTDGTMDIVKEFYAKYPHLIVPILQKENQYQLGVNKLPSIFLPIVKGKYIALNEGDDFWTDDYKLQKQVDYIENHDDCSMVVHRSNKVKEDGQYYQIIKTKVTNSNYTLKDILLHHTMFSTNSILMRTAILHDNIDVLNSCPSFDYLIKALAGLNGNIYGLEDNMSCYRVMAKGSWSERIASHPEKLFKHLMTSVQVFEYLYNHPKYHHQHLLKDCINKRKFKAYNLIQDYQSIFQDPALKKLYKPKKLKQRFKIVRRLYRSKLLQLLSKCSYRLQSKTKQS